MNKTQTKEKKLVLSPTTYMYKSSSTENIAFFCKYKILLKYIPTINNKKEYIWYK